MKFKFKTSPVDFFAVVIIFLSAIFVFLNLTRGHVWGDDFAGYLNQAQSILNGDPRSIVDQNKIMNQRSVIPPGPDAYPWGYPLILIPTLKLFGLSALALKTVNSVFWVGALLGVYFFAKKRLAVQPALLTLSIVAYSPLFIQLNDLIQSDIPFLAMVYAVIWVVDCANEKLKDQFIIGVLIFLAIFIRTTGILLFLLLLPRLFNSHNNLSKLKILVAPIIMATGLFLVQAFLFPSGESSYLSHFEHISWNDVWQNGIVYFQAGSQLFGSTTVGYGFYLLFTFLFFIKQKTAFRTDIGIQYFFYATIAILLVWPEDQGARFLVPIIPIFLVRAFEGMNTLEQKIKIIKPILQTLSALGVVVFIVSALMSGFNNLRSERAINGPFDSVSAEAFKAVTTQTAPDDVLVFFKPRAGLLFTKRQSYAADSCVGYSNADFVLIHLKQADNLQVEPDLVTNCDVVIEKPVFENKRFALYAIDRSRLP